MNRRAILYGVAYAALVILFKLYILLGGYSNSRFGFYFSTATAAFAIIPFYYFAIRGVRDRENSGVIAGREAARIALTVFAVGALITGVYNYAEFKLKGKELAVEYYRSEQYTQFLKRQPKIKPEQYEKIVAEQIRATEDAAFKATTGKLFSLLIIGGSAAFITSALMKKRARKTTGAGEIDPHLN